MAIYCTECKIIYDRLLHNCPNCGSALVSDGIDAEVLRSKGYKYRNKARNTESAEGDTELRNFRKHFRSGYEIIGNPNNGKSSSASSGGGNSQSDYSGFFENVTDNEFDISHEFYEDTQDSGSAYSEEVFNNSYGGGNIRTRRHRNFHFPRISFGTAVRIILFVFVTAVLIGIIVNIDEIVGGIFAFLLSMLPTVLIIAVIVWIVKSIFK